MKRKEVKRKGVEAIPKRRGQREGMEEVSKKGRGKWSKGREWKEWIMDGVSTKGGGKWSKGREWKEWIMDGVSTKGGGKRLKGRNGGSQFEKEVERKEWRESTQKGGEEVEGKSGKSQKVRVEREGRRREGGGGGEGGGRNKKRRGGMDHIHNYQNYLWALLAFFKGVWDSMLISTVCSLSANNCGAIQVYNLQGIPIMSYAWSKIDFPTDFVLAKSAIPKIETHEMRRKLL